MIEILESFEVLLNKTKQIIDNLRTIDKNNIYFLQLGAGDGIMFDFVEQITIPSDFGILVEPYDESFQLLLKNKPSEKFPNYTFKKCAVLPDRFFNLNLTFNVQVRRAGDSISGGNHFFPGQTKHGCEFIKGECIQISLQEFLKKNVTHFIDVLIIDIEGLDGDIIMEYLDLQQPSVIIFEYWQIMDEMHYPDIRQSHGLDVEKLQTVINKLNLLGYSLIRYADDYCAFKTDL